MLAYPDAVGALDKLKVPPNFGADVLTGDLAGTWPLTVTKNRRMIFHVNAAGAIEDLNLKDYH